ncbi:hypothetical protein ERHA54_24380 [Erwinia rhapontici]|uniref:hypothetical protein n=1 Tax=Erwinia rhapontici TaxID=55212 RepID=UPI001BB3F66C|nr:hypothetical protein [Erwinia rhapontici]BCQ39835.1 hypothetical protein ERHA54_24380 [Erwinia rhapontici]
MAGDLDLFYFLVDSYAGPFIEALSIKKITQLRGEKYWPELQKDYWRKNYNFFLRFLVVFIEK